MDIWGLMRTTVVNYQKAPQALSTFELDSIANRKLSEATSVDERTKLMSIMLEERLKLEEDWIEKKPESKKETIIHWKVKGRKISRILDFFYSIYTNRRKWYQNRQQRYIYRLDIIDIPKRRKHLKERFISLRLVKLFYITMSYRQFRTMAMSMRRKLGNFEENYLLSLEGRLVSTLYRTSFIASPFLCIQLVKEGYILVDFAYRGETEFKVPLLNIITFDKLAKKIIYVSLLMRLAKKRSLFNPPGYLFVSYIFLFAYTQRYPRRKDLVFPISVDFNRAAGYAF